MLLTVVAATSSEGFLTVVSFGLKILTVCSVRLCLVARKLENEILVHPGCNFWGRNMSLCSYSMSM